MSINWRKTAVTWPLVLAFTLGALSLTYAAFQLRVLAFDGGNFSYHIMTNGTSIRNPGLYRYIAILPQAPTLLFIRIFGFDEMGFSRMLLALSYSWFPVIGALAAIALCFLYKKPEIALGPLLTFGFVSLPVAGLAVGTVPELISLFWIAYLIQVYGRRTWLENSALFLICLPLAFGHETAIILAALMLLLAILQKYWFAASLQLFTLAGYAIRLLIMPPSRVAEVTYESWKSLDPYVVTATAFLATLFLSSATARFLSPAGRRRAFWMNLALGSSALLYFVITDLPAGLDGKYRTFDWRMYATSLLALITATLWILDTRLPSILEKYSAPFAASWWRYLYATALVGMLIGASIDYRGTLLWESEVKRFRNYMVTRPESCVEIPWKVYREEFDFALLQNYNAGHVWAMLQEDGIVDKFVFVIPPATHDGSAQKICNQLNGDPAQIDSENPEHPAPLFTINKEAFTYSFLREK